MENNALLLSQQAQAWCVEATQSIHMGQTGGVGPLSFCSLDLSPWQELEQCYSELELRKKQGNEKSAAALAKRIEAIHDLSGSWE